MSRGRLYGIGVGPGDSELLTLKAVRIIAESDIIAYAAPKESGESMARGIASPHIPRGKSEYPIYIPMLASNEPASRIYDEAACDLAKAMDSGKQVAVLCEGDPFFYGSFMYLFARLHEAYECETVAGVSSILAGAAVAGMPLAARNDSLTVLPAPMSDVALTSHLQFTSAAVIIKLGRHFSRIGRLFESLDLIGNACYISHATHAKQVVLPLQEAFAMGIEAPYFSLILWHKEGNAWLSPQL